MDFFGPEILILSAVAAGFVFLFYWISALIEIIRSEFKTSEDKYVFLILIILLPLIGTIVYYAYGREHRLNYHSEQDELV